MDDTIIPQQNELIAAIDELDISTIKRLIDEGVDVNALDESSRFTPLRKAVSKNSLEIVKMLLDSGASVDAKTRSGETALNCAENADIVRLLLQYGADVGNQDWDYGFSPLYSASATGQADIAQILVEHGADVDEVDEEGYAPLHAALVHGYREVVEVLLRAGADVDIRDAEGRTPLHAAVSGGYGESVKLLLDYDAEVDIANHQGDTPLHYAAYWQKEDTHTIIHVLLAKGAPINQLNYDGLTPLALASSRRNIVAVKELLRAGADINSASKKGKTPLMMASVGASVESAKLLIEQGADVNNVNKYGDTALLLACESSYGEGPLEIVKLLIENGAEVNRVNNDGESALHVAIKKGHLHSAHYLLLHNAQAGDGSDELQDLYYAALNAGHAELINLLVRDKRIDVTLKDPKGALALHHALVLNDNNLVATLIGRGIDVNAVHDVHRYTPLHRAAQEGYVEAAKLLMQHGAFVDAQDGRGFTPLDYAEYHKHFEFARILRDGGAFKKKVNQLPENFVALPVLVLRSFCCFPPGTIIPVAVGSSEGINATTYALNHDEKILVCPAKNSNGITSLDDLGQHATFSVVSNMFKTPGGGMKIMLEGKEKASLIQQLPHLDCILFEASIVSEDQASQCSCGRQTIL